MNRYEGKIAVVTGGNSGIGYATAERLAAEGATVIITGRRPEAVAEAAEQLGSNVHGVTADASDAAATAAALAKVAADHGTIDVLFLNAGIAPFVPFEATDEATFDGLFATNVRGPYFTIQKVLPHLSEGAAIVLNTSIVSYMGLQNVSAYSATKAAFRSFARTLAAELGPRGIRINAVAPGPIETPLFGKTGVPEKELEGFASALSEQMPLGRFGRAEEIASAVAFLGSSDASFITGVELSVDGGLGQV